MLVYRHVGGRGLEQTSRKLQKGGTSIGSVLLLLMTDHAFLRCTICHPHCPFTPVSGLLTSVSSLLNLVSSLLIPVSSRVCVLPAPMCVSSTLNGRKTIKTGCSFTRAHAIYCRKKYLTHTSHTSHTQPTPQTPTPNPSRREGSLNSSGVVSDSTFVTNQTPFPLGGVGGGLGVGSVGSVGSFFLFPYYVTRAHAYYCHLHFSPAPSASSAGRRGRRGRSFHYSLLYTRG